MDEMNNSEKRFLEGDQYFKDLDLDVHNALVKIGKMDKRLDGILYSRVRSHGDDKFEAMTMTGCDKGQLVAAFMSLLQDDLFDIFLEALSIYIQKERNPIHMLKLLATLAKLKP